MTRPPQQPLIKAICFDVGGTLRTSEKIEPDSLDHLLQLQAFLRDTGDPLILRDQLAAGEKAYRNWCKKTLIELGEADLWSQYMLPEYPREFIRQNAVEINRIWRESSVKTIHPDTVETIKTLHQRGYTLGIISNTTSSLEVPEMLAENGITDLFSCVLISCVYGRRKPHPSLFLEAARQMGYPPEQCAYVGDNLSRDLVGPRQAGYGEVAIIHMVGCLLDEYDPDDEIHLEAITEMVPDHRISRLSQLLQYYPALPSSTRHTVIEDQSSTPLYEAALSTMWGVDQKMLFGETFKAARELGFLRFELNHKVSRELYSQVDTNRYYISTVHDPCPAPYTYDEIKARDLMISSLDEALRIQSVDQIKKTFDLAYKLGSKSVVVHPGTIKCDHSLERRMRELFRQGRKQTKEYEDLLIQIRADRALRIQPHLEQVVQSLHEIIAFARGSGISLGLENRYRYYDIPLPDEMALFLDLCREDWLGFQFDTGHAYTLDALGLAKMDDWLERFNSRMVGVHLHDVIGITDHQVPGKGGVDFDHIAHYLPDECCKTLEIGPHATLSDLSDALELLAERDCINRL